MPIPISETKQSTKNGTPVVQDTRNSETYCNPLLPDVSDSPNTGSFVISHKNAKVGSRLPAMQTLNIVESLWFRVLSSRDLEYWWGLNKKIIGDLYVVEVYIKMENVFQQPPEDSYCPKLLGSSLSNSNRHQCE